MNVFCSGKNKSANNDIEVIMIKNIKRTVSKKILSIFVALFFHHLGIDAAKGTTRG
jgi:hypothetical protein